MIIGILKLDSEGPRHLRGIVSIRQAKVKDKQAVEKLLVK
jgi:hypothetical protein